MKAIFQFEIAHLIVFYLQKQQCLKKRALRKEPFIMTTFFLASTQVLYQSSDRAE